MIRGPKSSEQMKKERKKERNDRGGVRVGVG